MSHTRISGGAVASPARHSTSFIDMQAGFFDLLSTGNVDKASELFAADGQLHFPGLRPVRGRPLVRRMLGIIRRRFDDIAWTPLRPAIGSDGWVAVSWQVAGTFRDTGLPYENEGLSLVCWNEDGLIAMLSDYFKDTLAFQPPLKAAAREVAARPA